MTQCERLSDRIPDVAHGRSVWTAEEQSHLESCADCRAEWELVVTAGRLGMELPPLSSPEVMTATLAGRLAGERVAVKARRRSWLAVGLAAAAVTIIAVRIPRSPTGLPTPIQPAPAIPVGPTPAPTQVPTPGSPVASSPAIQLPELDGLPDTELESILGSLDESPTVPTFDGTGLDQPDDHQLEQALEAWEG